VDRKQNRTDKKTTKRLFFILAFFLAGAVIIVGKLAELQIKDHEEYRSIVLNQLTVQQEVTPERGTITDRNGVVLATNKTVYNVILCPDDIIRQMEEDEENNSDKKTDNDVYYDFTDADYAISYHGTRLNDMIAEVLSKYLNVEKSDILEKAAKNGRMYELVKKNVEEEIAEKIKAFIAEFSLKKQIYFVTSSKRYYPRDSLACHVIGFTNSEGVGIYGVEAYYNNVLEGTSGKYILAQDARKNDMPFEYERFIDAQDGNTIRLTIDVYIQYELENQLEKTYIESGAANRVCGIVMDVDTGEILAMATYPSFNLNSPYVLDEYSQAELDAMNLDPDSDEYNEQYYTYLYKMWNNKCITETYEPGSTFKVITSSMALEEGVIKEDDTFLCPGYWTVEGWSKPISCAKETGHGLVTFRYGLQQSCNPTLMQVAERLGREKFYYYFGAFGYTEKTGIDLPGEVGSIYASYKNFSKVSLAVYSFGQTFKTTAMQQLRAITAVANGGTLLTPHVMLDILDADGNVVQSYGDAAVRQVVSEETCELMADILEEGVATDGAAKNAYVKGYRVAAKTGTSEKRDEYDENGNTPYRVGSTAAFAPADDPQVSSLIVVDKPLGGSVYGGTVAAPYISDLMGYVLPYIGVEAQYTADELAKLDVTVGNYVGATIENCITDLSWRGFEYEFIGEGDTVTAQVPAAGTRISSDSGKLYLYTGDSTPSDECYVPNFLNMSAFNANNAAVSAGLNVTFSGSVNGSTATVIGQSIAAGTMVPRGTVIEIELRHLDGLD